MQETKDELLEKLILEQQVARRNLLNKGLSFDVPVLSILKYLPGGKRKSELIKTENGEEYVHGKKIRTFTIYKPYLRTMDVMAEMKLKLKINLVELIGSTNPIRYRNTVIKENNYLMCQIIAAAVLNRTWKIKLFLNLLARYLQARIHSDNLESICAIIEEMEDAGNFINSTVSMAGTDRTSAPKPEKIEENPPKPEVKQ